MVEGRARPAGRPAAIPAQTALSHALAVCRALVQPRHTLVFEHSEETVERALVTRADRQHRAARVEIVHDGARALQL